MKKIFFLSVFLFLFLSGVLAQFSDTTELAYLQIVNKSGNIDLIKDNIANAENVAFYYIAEGYDKQNQIQSLFFKELAESCYLSSKFVDGFFYILVQRFLFPNERIQKSSKLLLYELSYACGMSENDVNALYNKTLFHKDISFENYVDLAETLILMFDKKADKKIRFLLKIIYDKFGKLSYKLQHWLFLKTIGIKEKVIKKVWQDINDVPKEIYRHENLRKKYRLKFYRKSIKHYIKIGAFVKAKELLKEYKNQKPLFFCYSKIIFYELRCVFRV